MTKARLKALMGMADGRPYNCNLLGTSYTTMVWLAEQGYIVRVKKAEFLAIRSPGRNAFFQLTQSGADAIVNLKQEMMNEISKG